jgi:hypothetical protein
MDSCTDDPAAETSVNIRSEIEALGESAVETAAAEQKNSLNLQLQTENVTSTAQTEADINQDSSYESDAEIFPSDRPGADSESASQPADMPVSADGVHITYDNSYRIEQSEDGSYLLTMIIDRDFLESPDTVYPVLIDPTISRTRSQILTASYRADGTTVNSNYMAVGNYGGYETLSYVKMTCIDTLTKLNPNNFSNKDVLLYVSQLSCASIADVQVGCYDSNLYSEGVSGLSYDALNSNLGTLQDTTSFNSNHSGYGFWVGGLFRNWLKYALGEGGFSQNYGLILKANSTGQPYKLLASATNSSADYLHFEITYLEQYDNIPSEHVVFIRNVASGMYLDVHTSNSDNVIQYYFHGDTNQQWFLQSNGDFYKLCSMYYTGNKSLSHPGDGDATGRNVQLADTDSAWLFRLVQNADGTWRILSLSGKETYAVTVDPNSDNNVFMLDYTGSTYQKCVLELANYGNFSQTISYTPSSPARLSAIQTSNREYDQWPAWSSSSYYQYSTTNRADRLANIKTKALATVAGGYAAQQPNAAKMLKHFLDNNGSTYTVNFKQMNNERSYSYEQRKNQINAALDAAEHLALQNHTIVFYSISEYSNSNSESSDWGHSIGSYYSSIKCIATKSDSNYSATIYYYLNDFYDWDKSIYSMGNLPVSPREMWELHHGGLAKCYEVIGVNELYITWSEGQRWGSGASINDIS